MRVCIVLIFVFVFAKAIAQKPDTVSLGDSIVLMDQNKQDQLIETIKDYSQKRNVFAQLLEAFLKDPGGQTNQWDFSYDEFNQYQNYIIRDIIIQPEEVFGASASDSSRGQILKLVQKTGDFLHVKTRKWIIRNQLLFEEGKKLAPFELAESERLLRKRSYLFDAEIRVIPIGSDSVDVIVVTEDLWSLAPGGALFLNDESAKINLTENNFLGYGFTTRLEYLIGPRFNQKGWDVGGLIRIENIFDQYVNLSLYRKIDRYGSRHLAGIERFFASPLIDYAGGINFYWQDMDRQVIGQDTVIWENQQYNLQEYWFGYGTTLFNKYEFQNEYYVSLAFKSFDYNHQPGEMLGNIYQDNQRYLLKAGYAFRKFHKTRFVMGLGRNEDIPVGSLLAFTAGWVDGQRRDQWYTGLDIGYSVFSRKLGYFSLIGKAGTYLFNQETHQTAMEINLLYFTNLLKVGNYRIRHFLRMSGYYVQDPRLLTNMVNIDQKEGIRGFNANLYGNKKIVLNYEVNLFPPLKWLGFNFAGVGFADFGLLSREGKRIWNGQLFRGYGLGLRVRNENLIFQSIQLQLGYYPDRVVNQPIFRLFGQQRDFYNFEKFRFQKPSEIGYTEFNPL